jgi:hypothetical protein
LPFLPLGRAALSLGESVPAGGSDTMAVFAIGPGRWDIRGVPGVVPPGEDCATRKA